MSGAVEQERDSDPPAVVGVQSGEPHKRSQTREQVVGRSVDPSARPVGSSELWRR